MSESAIRDYARGRGFHRQTLERWLGWEEADRDVLAAIAAGLKASENHLRDMMDWLEEIALRDDAKIHEVLASPAIDARSAPTRASAAPTSSSASKSNCGVGDSLVWPRSKIRWPQPSRR